MLTLPETIIAINALDTPPDIIAQACQQVLTSAETLSSPQAVAKAIIREFIDRTDTVDLILASAMIAGRVGAIVAGGEDEEGIAKRLIDVLTSEFISAARARRKRAAEAPK
jgi:hypothetical protein